MIPPLALALATPQWSLDTNSDSQIPSGRVHGSISSQEFAPEAITLQPNGLGLRFLPSSRRRHHSLTTRFSYLSRLIVNNDIRLAGKSWTVTKDTKAKDAAQVVKRWTANPKFAPISKTS